VYVTDLASGRETRVTTGAGRDLTHGTAEFVAQEEMDRDEGYWWSPDGRWLAVQETDTREVERLRISDPLHPESAPDEPAYPRAGRNNAVVTVALYPSAGGAPRPVRWDRQRYPYLAAVRWTEGAPLTLVVQNRPQTEELVLAVAPTTGESRTLLRESDEAWVNLDEAMPRWLPDGSGFLWTTERSGRWQVELRGPDGVLVRALTTPEVNYRRFVSLDFAHRRVWLLGGEDPRETQLARVSLDGGAPEWLTRDHAEHEAMVARGGALHVRQVFTLDAPPRWTVHHEDGAPAGTLTSVAEAPPWRPRVELLTVGSQGLHAALVRPRDFDPRRRYPVLLTVYGGPHSRMVTRAPGRYLIAQWLADQGFVVALADGRGTPARGRAWERALKLHAGDVPLEDQVEALRALGAREPALDLSRVGVHGWSYGGYLAAYAVLERPDVFHAAVAGAPVTDWRDYDTHYTERYLGHPETDRDAYERASLLPRAERLSRPLLLVHGTADDNVYLLHSLRLAGALVEHGRTFDYLPLPGATHMVTAAPQNRALYTRMVAFFRQHLGAPR
jgi:dipeptidyl-peptidase-4